MKIGYRIIVIIVAIISVALLVTVPFTRVACESVIAQIGGWLGQYKGDEDIKEIIENNNGEMPKYITEEISFRDFVDPESGSLVYFAMSAAETFADKEMSPSLKKLIPAAITLIVCAGLIVVFAIITIIVSFTKNNRRVIYSSLGAIGASLMFTETLEAITHPFENGDITFASIFQSTWANLIGEIKIFELAPSFWVIPALFGFIILFTVLYNYTLPEKEKKARKEMLGEAE